MEKRRRGSEGKVPPIGPLAEGFQLRQTESPSSKLHELVTEQRKTMTSSRRGAEELFDEQASEPLNLMMSPTTIVSTSGKRSRAVSAVL
jgi:hypothetical protein